MPSNLHTAQPERHEESRNTQPEANTERDLVGSAVTRGFGIGRPSRPREVRCGAG